MYYYYYYYYYYYCLGIFLVELKSRLIALVKSIKAE